VSKLTPSVVNKKLKRKYIQHVKTQESAREGGRMRVKERKKLSPAGFNAR
jgi:hypothetical protein